MSTFLILGSFVSAVLFLFMVCTEKNPTAACSPIDTSCPADAVLRIELVFSVVKVLELLVQLCTYHPLPFFPYISLSPFCDASQTYTGTDKLTTLYLRS